MSTTITTPTTTTPAPDYLAPFLPTRRLDALAAIRRDAAEAATGDDFAPVDVEALRDRLAKRRDLQQPREVAVVLSQLHVDFHGGPRATCDFVAGRPSWLPADMPVYLTETASRQLAHHVLPARGLTFLSAMRGAHAVQGRRLSTLTWSLLASKVDRPVVLRVARRKVDGEIAAVVRAVVTDRYAPYDNVDLLTDLLGVASLRGRCVDYVETDDTVRVRFVLRDGRPALDKPVPMIEAWNSETGCRSVGVAGGAWKLVCTNGMTSWTRDLAWQFRHVGTRDRLADKIEGSMRAVTARARGVVDAYEKAREVEIDNLIAFMERSLRGEITGEQIERAKGALDHTTTTPGRMLASVVDAVTLAAQHEIDALRQNAMEGAAVALMSRGLAEAQANGGRIVA